MPVLAVRAFQTGSLADDFHVVFQLALLRFLVVPLDAFSELRRYQSTASKAPHVPFFLRACLVKCRELIPRLAFAVIQRSRSDDDFLVGKQRSSGNRIRRRTSCVFRRSSAIKYLALWPLMLDMFAGLHCNRESVPNRILDSFLVWPRMLLPPLPQVGISDLTGTHLFKIGFIRNCAKSLAAASVCWQNRRFPGCSQTDHMVMHKADSVFLT